MVLAPVLRRKQAEFKPLDSIGDFRSHLQALARRNLVVMPPASGADARPPWSAGFVEPAQLGLVPTPKSRMPQGQSATLHPARLPPPSARRVASRRQLLRRRRRVLFVLSALVVASLALGALLSLDLLWAVSGGAALLVGGYLGLLVHLRTKTKTVTTGGEYAAPAEPELWPPIADDDQPTAELELNIPSPPEAPDLLAGSVGS